jgi:hypothetical protein
MVFPISPGLLIKSLVAGAVLAVVSLATSATPTGASPQRTGNQFPSVVLTSPDLSATFAAPATILVTAGASDPDGYIARVDFFADSALILSDTTSPYSIAWSDVPAGSYILSAVARDNSGAAATSSIRKVTVTPGTNRNGGLPPTWEIANVGYPSRSGSAAYASGTFTIKGAGNDIGGNADQFTFVYQTLDGDGEMVARIGGLEKSHAWAKAGVMIRDELTADAKKAVALVTAEKRLVFQRRIAAGASTIDTLAGAATTPCWLKLTRRGGVFAAYYATDGSTWKRIGSETVYMKRMAYVGLAVNDRSTRTSPTAAFSHVTVKSRPTSPKNEPPVTGLTAPLNGTTYTAPATLAVNATASDADGSIAKVDFYAGPNLIGSDSTSPYTITWSSVPAGKHTLKAVAQDSSGAATASAGVEITVIPHLPPKDH